MNASLLHAYGEPLSVVKLPVPAVVPGHVLVRVQASGVNPLDTKIRAGAATHAQTMPPAVLGIDVAGTVLAVAADVAGFAPDDRVYGMTGGVGGVPGSLAEYASVDARLLAHMPGTWTPRQAAAVPLGIITAWEGLIDRARLRPGDKVLIHGGAGGVGHLAVQLAVSRGAEVFATGSAGSADIIRDLGGTAIDFRVTPTEEYVAEYTGGDGFDVIFDTVGGPVLDASFEAVRRYTGHVVSILGWGLHSLAPLSFREQPTQEFSVFCPFSPASDVNIMARFCVMLRNLPSKDGSVQGSTRGYSTWSPHTTRISRSRAETLAAK